MVAALVIEGVPKRCADQRLAGFEYLGHGWPFFIFAVVSPLFNEVVHSLAYLSGFAPLLGHATGGVVIDPVIDEVTPFTLEDVLVFVLTPYSIVRIEHIEKMLVLTALSARVRGGVATGVGIFFLGGFSGLFREFDGEVGFIRNDFPNKN